MRVVPILLSLGTNLGDRQRSLSQAVERLAWWFEIETVSRVVESPAMYLDDQPDFLNAAVLAKTDLGPRETLARLKEIESAMGRIERVRNGPREIDIDLIAYGRLQYRFVEESGNTLQIPHPRLAERAFVLKPLADICPRFNLPRVGIVKKLLDNLGEAADAAQWVPDAILPLHRR